MNALMFPQSIASSSLYQNINVDPSLRLRYLLHLQSMNHANNMNNLTMLPMQETPSPISDHGLTFRQDSTSDDSRASPIDERLSKIQELEQINKASLYKVLQQSRKPVPKQQKIQSPPTVNPMFAGNPSMNVKRAMEEYAEEELGFQKKVKTNGFTKHTPSNIVITQPQQLTDLQKLKKQKEQISTKINAVARLDGCLKKGDLPATVLSFKMDERTREFVYLVEWKPRRDGSQPNNSLVSKSDIMRCDPGLLVSFYEDRMIRMMETVRY